MKNSPKTQLAHLCLAGLGVSLMLLSAPGCGSSDPVPKGNVVCDPGRSDPCACSDGSTGAQTCNETGTGFGSCSCGGAGGSAGAGASGGAAGDGGTGASGGAAGSGGSGGVGAGGSGGAAGTGGSGGVSGSAGTGGAPPVDDPCLAEAEYAYSCDPECWGQDGSFCRPMDCANQQINWPPRDIGPVTEFPWRMRLPGRQGTPCGCADVAYAVSFDTNWETPTGYRVRATIGDGWKILGTYNLGICGKFDLGNQCDAHSGGRYLVMTDRPDAPAVDLVLELIPLGTECQ